jgi:hypothetical protein
MWQEWTHLQDRVWNLSWMFYNRNTRLCYLLKHWSPREIFSRSSTETDKLSLCFITMSLSTYFYITLPRSEIIIFAALVNFYLHCVVIKILHNRCQRWLRRTWLILLAFENLHRIFGEWIQVGNFAVGSIDQEVAVNCLKSWGDF